MEKELLKLPETLRTFAIGGFGFGGGNTANKGVIFTTLNLWEERHGEEQSAEALSNKMMGIYSTIPEARIVATNPPAIRGLGSFSGFQFELEDRRGNNPLDTLVQVSNQLIQQGNQTPELQALFTTFAANSPQMLIEIDRNKAKALQINVDDILNTLQSYLGARYVNDFNLQQRTYRVYVHQLRERGQTITKAAVEAAQERLRPILITAFAALLGFWPLVVAEGAGAQSRQSLGTAVFGGLLVSTFLSLFVVPVLYIVIGNIRDRLQRGRKTKKTEKLAPSSDRKIPSGSQR